jgi:hypothetical protein
MTETENEAYEFFKDGSFTLSGNKSDDTRGIWKVENGFLHMSNPDGSGVWISDYTISGATLVLTDPKDKRDHTTLKKSR